MDLIDKMYRSVEQGDMDALATCFTPDAAIWHNVDETDKSLATAAMALSHLCQSANRVSYENRKQMAVGNLRFVQHVITADLKSGKNMRLPGMMRIELSDDGLISRIEEYYDSRALDPLTG